MLVSPGVFLTVTLTRTWSLAGTGSKMNLQECTLAVERRPTNKEANIRETLQRLQSLREDLL